ncbi:MAG: hypothetical protein JSW39_23520 [Desulfobacterales bacterium]|nr:MAG: hypothetical protein JSW39_23520 [Desulfobacterales bacterium]
MCVNWKSNGGQGERICKSEYPGEEAFACKRYQPLRARGDPRLMMGVYLRINWMERPGAGVKPAPAGDVIAARLRLIPKLMSPLTF